MNKNNQTPEPFSSPDKLAQETEIISGSEILIRSLIAEGVDTMFGYPGGAIMPVFVLVKHHTQVLK